MIPFIAAGVFLFTSGLVNLAVKYTIGGWEGTPLLMDGSGDWTGEPMVAQ